VKVQTWTSPVGLLALYSRRRPAIKDWRKTRAVWNSHGNQEKEFFVQERRFEVREPRTFGLGCN